MLKNKKLELRRKFLKIRSEIDRKEKILFDEKINNNLKEFFKEKEFNAVNAFISDGTEPNIIDTLNWLLNAGKRIYLPRFNKQEESCQYELVEVFNLNSDLQLGKYGILEPKLHLKSANIRDFKYNIWLIPGVVFDNKRNRLGRGKGIYDRLLKNTEGLTVGVFYKCQETDCVPVEEHDYKLNKIITEDISSSTTFI